MTRDRKQDFDYQVKYDAAERAFDARETEDAYAPSDTQYIAHQRLIEASWSPNTGMAYGEEAVPLRPEDATFIASARNDPVEERIETLLDELARVRKEFRQIIAECSVCGRTEQASKLDKVCAQCARIVSILHLDAMN